MDDHLFCLGDPVSDQVHIGRDTEPQVPIVRTGEACIPEYRKLEKEVSAGSGAYKIRWLRV